MDSLEANRIFILSTIADDYENFEIVYIEVTGLAAQCGRTPSLAEVHQGLSSLIESGLALAYRLSLKHEFEEIPGCPPQEEMEGWRYAFLITAAGIPVLHAHPVFDEEGRLLPSWHY